MKLFFLANSKMSFHDWHFLQFISHVLGLTQIYGDIIYDKAFNESFHAKLESLQYNASLVITGAIRGSSTEKIYDELSLEYSKSRRWYRKMNCLYKVVKTESPSYLFDFMPNSDRQCQTKNLGNVPSFFVKHDYFNNYFSLLQ